MNPKISIIVPNYNHERYLQQRLDTIFGQTYTDFEVILLDDASTDNSRLLIDKYKNHPKVSHVVYNEVNSGSPFRQWQKGIALAQGDFIWIAESDDYAALNFLEVLVECIKYSKTVLAYCATMLVDEKIKSKSIDTWGSRMDFKRWSNDYINSGKKEIENYFRFRNIIPNASAALFDVKVAKKVKLPLEMKYCGDWYFWIEVLKLGNLAYVAKPLNFFRKHGETTREFKNLEKERIRFKEYMSIIISNSSFFERIRHLKKYSWIFRECYKKRKTLGRFPNLKLQLPFEFQLGYIFFTIKNSFNG